jgi:hypothetical protein
MQEVDTFKEIVHQKDIVKLDQEKNPVLNHINILDYLPKPVNKVMSKFRFAINSRVKDVALG